MCRIALTATVASVGFSVSGLAAEAGFVHHDVRVLGVIVSTSIIVAIAGASGLFHFVAIRIVKLTRGEPRRHARRLLCACAAVWLLGAAPASSATLAGIELPRLMQTGSGVLELSVCGVRDTLWIEHYVSAVYVPRGESLQAVRDPHRPKAVSLHVIEARYLPGDIPRKWRVALERELPPGPMREVREAYRRLVDGDVLTILYTPRQGVTLSVNGKLLVQARGHGVIRSILRAWAEGESVSSKLERLRVRHPC